MSLLLFRDLKILFRNPRGWLLTLFFFLLFVTMFAVALEGDPEKTIPVAPAGIWLAIIFSLLLSFDGLFERDIRTGVFTQLRLSDTSFLYLVISKALTIFLITCLPLICIVPIAAIFLHLDAMTSYGIMLSLLIGAPALISLGVLSAAILSGSRNSGFLLALLTLPFFIPIVIFAIGGIKLFPSMGMWNSGFLALAGISLVSIAVCLPASVAALNTNLE